MEIKIKIQEIMIEEALVPLIRTIPKISLVGKVKDIVNLLMLNISKAHIVSLHFAHLHKKRITFNCFASVTIYHISRFHYSEYVFSTIAVVVLFPRCKEYILTLYFILYRFFNLLLLFYFACLHRRHTKNALQNTYTQVHLHIKTPLTMLTLFVY